jgi:hypothetical protein
MKIVLLVNFILLNHLILLAFFTLHIILLLTFVKLNKTLSETWHIYT